ncbi:MAG: D-aminoacyl-tRNA deacylase [Acidobacteriota bacterium]|jgi:D-aminoacyl-tRNA deacylase
MRSVVQRVRNARVTVDGTEVGAIGPGLLVLVAVQGGDGPDDLDFMTRKLINLRVFADPEGKMNLSVRDVGGSILLVSQFTLFGDCRKGNRPSFTRSAAPQVAEDLYLQLAETLEREGVTVETGRFQAMMQVHSVNDGPVTVIIDSKKGFY